MCWVGGLVGDCVCLCEGRRFEAVHGAEQYRTVATAGWVACGVMMGGAASSRTQACTAAGCRPVAVVTAHHAALLVISTSAGLPDSFLPPYHPPIPNQPLPTCSFPPTPHHPPPPVSAPSTCPLCSPPPSCAACPPTSRRTTATCTQRPRRPWSASRHTAARGRPPVGGWVGGGCCCCVV